MTYEEALDYFNRRIKLGQCGKETTQRKAFEAAIEALKKQTAIPPNIVDWSGLYDDGLTGFKCPSCGSTIEYLDDHCECCGQAIDWSKEES